MMNGDTLTGAVPLGSDQSGLGRTSPKNHRMPSMLRPNLDSGTTRRCHPCASNTSRESVKPLSIH